MVLLVFLFLNKKKTPKKGVEPSTTEAMLAYVVWILELASLLKQAISLKII